MPQNDGPKSAGSGARNHGTETAHGTYVVYADDDDRYIDKYLERLVTGIGDDRVNCVQMTLSDFKRRNGSKLHTVLAPEVGVSIFPVACHFGTPCMVYKREWAIASPWLDCSENDYVFCSRIIDKYHPKITLVPGMSVDVDGQITKGLKDWVTVPPFYRGV
jgi:glycosyltransferase involved in cell wall biosynthesis